MGFLAILRNDFKTLFKCMNYKKVSYSGFYCKSCNYSSVSDEETFPTLQKPIPDKRILQLKRYDKIPHDFELIYRAEKTFYYSLAHCTLLTCGSICPPILTYITYRNELKFPCTFGEDILINNPSQLIILLSLSSYLLYMLYLIVSRFPFRLYRNKSTNDYIAVFPHLLLPWKMYKFSFKKGEVIIEKEPKIMPFQIGNFRIKNKRVIFAEEFFIRPYELDYMMAKPLPK